MTVHEHKEQHEEVRYVPDVQLLELKSQLEDLGRPSKKKQAYSIVKMYKNIYLKELYTSDTLTYSVWMAMVYLITDMLFL